MDRTLIGLIVGFAVLAGTATGWSQSNLTVVRHADNSIWAMTCEGDISCSGWTKIPGQISSQPTLAWDPVVSKYILMGVGLNQATIWRCTFNTDGSWNNDWKKLTGSSSSPVGVAGGGFMGSLGVYDGSGLFLGYFAQSVHNNPPSNMPAYQIFNPNISAFLIVELRTQPGLVGCNGITQLFFKSEDCSGQPYLFLENSTPLPLQSLFANPYSPGTYYLYDTTVPSIPPVSGSDIKSWADLSYPGRCQAETFSSGRAAFPVKQVDVPFMNTTLQYPIVVRPIR